MKAAEVAHRIQEQIKRAQWRYKRTDWSTFDIGDGHLCPISAFNRVVEQPWPEELTSIINRAVEDVLNLRVNLLGVLWPPKNAAQYQQRSYWHFDPISETFWPGAERYCFDVDYRHNRSRGDVKFVWEMNRLQFLQPVALLGAKQRKPELNQYALATILDWMDFNPPFYGVNWNSGIELALRLVSIAIVVSSSETGAIDGATRRRLRSCVAAHAFWLARFPSLFSSANNHQVAEGLGLIVAALLVPDLPSASEYMSKGMCIIKDAPASQFYVDGVGAEQSPTYSAFTLEMIATADAILEHAIIADASPIQERLTKAAAYLHLTLDQNGNSPRIGDDDEGRVLAISPIREERYVASVTAALAGQLKDPALCPNRRDAHWRDILFDSPIIGCPPREGLTNFPLGGYTVIRERISGRDMLFMFDHGPLGFLSIAAHGHADALSIWLHLDGMPVFVDAGTFLYHSGGAWRDYFRSSVAHNTLVIDEQSQSLTAGSFNWKYKADAWLQEVTEGAAWCVSARHNGYNVRYGVEHERTIRRTDNGILVLDRLDGQFKRTSLVNVSFLINPSLSARREGKCVVIESRNTPVVRVSGDRGTKLSISSERSDTDYRFYSPAFGAKSPATAIIAERGYAANEFATHIEVIPTSAIEKLKVETRGIIMQKTEQ
jgi:hypothetical protein